MNNTIKYTLATLSVVLLLMTSGWAGYYFGKDRKNNSELAIRRSVTASPSLTPTSVSSARVVKESSTPVVKTTQAHMTTSESDEELIKEALAAKLDVQKGILNIVINEIDETAAFGSAGVEGEMGGGFFVAAKDNSGQWTIVADGNGVIECSALEGHEISKDIVPECYDYDLGETVNR